MHGPCCVWIARPLFRNQPHSDVEREIGPDPAHYQDPERRWFFEAFVPDQVAVAGADGMASKIPWENVATDELASNPRYWELSPGARWHGFTHVAPGYAITDPNKLIVLTPGFDRATGAYADYGIPAPIVAEYLRENQVVPEKNDLNSLLLLLTPGVKSSKAGTLCVPRT